MYDYLNPERIQKWFETQSEDFARESAGLLEFCGLIADKIYNNGNKPEFEKVLSIDISQKKIEEARELFNIAFEQEIDAQRIGLPDSKNDETENPYIAFEEEPEVNAAFNFFWGFLEEGYDRLDFESHMDFRFLAEDHYRISVLCKNFNRVCDCLDRFVFFPNKIDYLSVLDRLKEDLSHNKEYLYDKWFGDNGNFKKRSHVGLKGGLAKKKQMEERIQQLTQKILEIDSITDAGELIIDHLKWHKSLIEINGGYPLSYPTITKYKKCIEQNFSTELKKKITISIRKK